MTSEGVGNKIEIAEPADSPVNRLAFKLRVTDGQGKPIERKEVTVRLEGDGGFAQNFSSKEIKRETDEAGEATFVWFRRGIVGRRLKAMIAAEPSEGEVSVVLEPTEEEQGVITGWQREWLKLPGRLAK